MGAKIAQERGTHAERTAAYSHDNDVLRREFGINLKPEVSESARASRADLADAWGGLVESALSGELANALEHVGEGDQEALGDCIISTL